MKHGARIVSILVIGLTLAVLVPFAMLGSGAAAVTGEEVDLEVTLNAPQHVAGGDDLLVNLAYANTGAVDSPDDTRVEVTLPAGVLFVQALDGQGAPLPPDEVSGSLLAWNVGAVVAGECCNHIWISTTVDAALAEGTELAFSAAIASSAVESDTADNTASITSVVCDMAGSGKQVNAGQAKPGDVLTYTITLNLQNRGNVPGPVSRQVILTDTLPAAHMVQFLGWVGTNQGEFDGQQLKWQGQVSAGEPLQLQYRLGVVGEVISGTQITNGVQLAWQGGKMDIDPVTTTVELPPYAHMFGVGGGQWQHQYGVDLVVPPGAISQTTRFEFHETFTGTHPVDAPPGWMFAHKAFELNAYQYGEIHQFGQPISITVHYQGGDVIGMKQNTLRLWYRSSPGEPWTILGEPKASGPGFITFETTHFTEFGLFARAAYELHLPFLGGR